MYKDIPNNNAIFHYFYLGIVDKNSHLPNRQYQGDSLQNLGSLFVSII